MKSSVRTIGVADRLIGPGQCTFIVAEAGVNHNEKPELAMEHIRLAKQAGADAIKFQNYTAGKLVTRTAPQYWHMGKDDAKTQYETFSRLDGLPKTVFYDMNAYAKELGIVLFSTPFDEESVDLLYDIGVPMFKVASADITYHQLLTFIGRKDKPVVLSTGAATVGEIEEAIQLIRSVGNDKIILLHCTLSYPAEFQDANLAMMQSMMNIFPDYPVGLSDHTYGLIAPVVAAALGACMIEKHFTIEKSMKSSPDHKLGVDPDELARLVESVRTAEMVMGSKTKRPIEAEDPALTYARRSIVALKNIPKGTKIQSSMITCKRPGTGIAPKFWDVVIGRTAQKDIQEDEIFDWQSI